MSRNPRMFSSSGVYHTILRSVNQQIIFEEDADYHMFLHILSYCKSKYDVEIYAYCLMENHVHMLIHSSPECLSLFFQSLGSSFVQWYNTKYSRYGHLFQERYHSRCVEDPQYYLNSLVYIHNNPIKAGICRYPSEYRWSSYNAYYGGKNSLIDTAFSIQLAGSLENLHHFFSFHGPKYESLKAQDFDAPKPHRRMNENELMKCFRQTSNLSSTHEVDTWPKNKRNQLIQKLYNNGANATQISRLLGISCATVYRVVKNKR